MFGRTNIRPVKNGALNCCSPLNSHAGSIFSHDKLLACGCPRRGVIIKYKLKEEEGGGAHMPSSHPMECTHECIMTLLHIPGEPQSVQTVKATMSILTAETEGVK